MYVLQEYRKLYQEKVLVSTTYTPENMYEYFRKLLRLVTRDTWYCIITHVHKTREHFDGRHIEALGGKIFCENQILRQLKYLEKNPKLFNISVK